MSLSLDQFFITPEEANERLDKILAARFGETGSRTYFQYLIDQNKVFVNGSPVKKRLKVSVGDSVEIHYILPPVTNVEPENIPLNIVYEDDEILIINKQAGMVVHPGAGHWSGTFVNALLFRCQQLIPAALATLPGEAVRPGIVHRLDKDTSGLLIAAKNLSTQQKLVEMFAARQVYKEYLAVCVGNPGNVTIEAPIARDPNYRQQMTISHEKGRTAISHLTTLKSNGILSLVRVVISTGRTHQIRVHMRHRGTPVLGDPVYGVISQNNKYNIHRQLLHAHKLRFNHPTTGKEIEILVDVPEDMAKIVKGLK